LVWKVYKGTELVASTKYAEEAAAVVSLSGDGGTVKRDGRVVWREGKEQMSAGDSYDFATEVMHNRVRDHNREYLARHSAA
jgi:hypothetical protein